MLAQVKNCGAFLSRTPGEGLYGHFCTVGHTPPAKPSHQRAPQAVYRTEGGRAERREGGRGELATEKEEVSKEDRGGDNTDRTLGDRSGASGAPSTGVDESLMEGADRKLGAVESRRGWRKVMRRCRRQEGRKTREWRQGGGRQQSGGGDGADEARQQHKRDEEGAEGATAPPQTAGRTEHRGDNGTVGGCWRETAESLCGTKTPAAMVATEA